MTRLGVAGLLALAGALAPAGLPDLPGPEPHGPPMPSPEDVPCPRCGAGEGAGAVSAAHGAGGGVPGIGAGWGVAGEDARPWLASDAFAAVRSSTTQVSLTARWLAVARRSVRLR